MAKIIDTEPAVPFKKIFVSSSNEKRGKKLTKFLHLKHNLKTYAHNPGNLWETQDVQQLQLSLQWTLQINANEMLIDPEQIDLLRSCRVSPIKGLSE